MNYVESQQKYTSLICGLLGKEDEDIHFPESLMFRRTKINNRHHSSPDTENSISRFRVQGGNLNGPVIPHAPDE